MDYESKPSLYLLTGSACNNTQMRAAALREEEEGEGTEREREFDERRRRRPSQKLAGTILEPKPLKERGRRCHQLGAILVMLFRWGCSA